MFYLHHGLHYLRLKRGWMGSLCPFLVVSMVHFNTWATSVFRRADAYCGKARCSGREIWVQACIEINQAGGWSVARITSRLAGGARSPHGYVCLGESFNVDFDVESIKCRIIKMRNLGVQLVELYWTSDLATFQSRKWRQHQAIPWGEVQVCFAFGLPQELQRLLRGQYLNMRALKREA